MRPDKPADCPLFPHRNGQWAKKINGRLHDFGKWDDLPAALAKYEASVADLRRGVGRHQIDAARLTLADAANHFLAPAEQ